MARKAAGAVQTEEQRSNPLKRKAGKGKEAWRRHPRLVADSWLYQGKPFTAKEKFCRNSCVVSGVHSEGPPRY